MGAAKQYFVVSKVLEKAREVLIPVLLNQVWRQEEVAATAPLQAQLETRDDCSLEEKK